MRGIHGAWGRAGGALLAIASVSCAASHPGPPALDIHVSSEVRPRAGCVDPSAAPASEPVSCGEIVFENEMSSPFMLVALSAEIDGVRVFDRVDANGSAPLADLARLTLFSGTVRVGTHDLVVRATFKGRMYGIYSYMRGYKFDVRSSKGFTTDPGSAFAIRAVAFERGGVTTPLEERPAMKFEVAGPDAP